MDILLGVIVKLVFKEFRKYNYMSNLERVIATSSKFGGFEEKLRYIYIYKYTLIYTYTHLHTYIYILIYILLQTYIYSLYKYIPT